MGRTSNINKEKVIATFLKLKNTTLTAKELNIKIYQVQYILKIKGLMLNRSDCRTKYKANYTFFEKIDTEEKAYWLGFLMADGCVQDHDSSKRLTLTLKGSDISHVEKFNLAIMSDHPVHLRTIKSGKMIGKQYCSTSVRSDKLCNDLILLGCTPRKSLTLKFPKIDGKLVHHFIRGYFDGDGSVFVTQEKHWRSGKFSPIIQICFTGTKEFLERVSNILLPITGDLKLNKSWNTTKNTYDLKFKGNKKVNPFYNYLYTDATVFLERKKKKFDDYFNKLDIQRLQSANPSG